jgi:hypothetical protein
VLSFSQLDPAEYPWVRQKALLKAVLLFYFEASGERGAARWALQYLRELEPERHKWRFLEMALFARERLQEEFREAWSRVRKEEWPSYYCTMPPAHAFF